LAATTRLPSELTNPRDQNCSKTVAFNLPGMALWGLQ